MHWHCRPWSSDSSWQVREDRDRKPPDCRSFPAWRDLSPPFPVAALSLRRRVNKPILKIEDVAAGEIEWSAHKWRPDTASMNCPVTRTRSPETLHAAFQHVTDAELAGDLLGVDRFSLVGE